MPPPSSQDNVSEGASTLKTRYPRKRLDPYGMKFAKGHRTQGMLQGKRPVTRVPKRAK